LFLLSGNLKPKDNFVLRKPKDSKENFALRKPKDSKDNFALNISAISWRPGLVVEDAGVPGETHRSWASNW
jgi:hypothetical protein